MHRIATALYFDTIEIPIGKRAQFPLVLSFKKNHNLECILFLKIAAKHHKQLCFPTRLTDIINHLLSVENYHKQYAIIINKTFVELKGTYQV